MNYIKPKVPVKVTVQDEVVKLCNEKGYKFAGGLQDVTDEIDDKNVLYI